MVTGQCECGAVRFSVAKVRATVTACHCRQCRRTSGHVWASTKAQTDDLTFETEDGLAWYKSSDNAERGFCNRCGASLFWRHFDEVGEISIGAGCLDNPTGMVTSKHIFVSDKGDYYDIADGLPQS